MRMDLSDIQSVQLGGQRLATYLSVLEKECQVGVSGNELDKLSYDLIRENNDIPAFLNYKGYPKSLCISINEEVIHGIPSSRQLQEGDLVGLDLGLIHEGWYCDSAITISVGTPAKSTKRLLQAVMEALDAGIDACRPGNHVGDISSAIENIARKYSVGIIRNYSGHGLGKSLHLPPNIPNVGVKGSGPIIKPDMILAIEPMFVLGSIATEIDPNGWTVRTRDSSLSAHCEHTVLVTSRGIEILTQR